MTVSAGTHKLSFVYDKDEIVSDGQDWVLIDNLRFTPFLVSPSVSTSQSGGGSLERPP